MNPNVCPSCGEHADPSANHCPQCGTRMRGRAGDTDFLGHRLRQRTAGRYRIGRRLGSGGMAAVYEATDSLDRRWAIKVLSDMLLGQADMVDRFEREARTVLRLRHPNIVQLHAFEPHEDLHFLVLEFVEGESLADRIQRKSSIPLDTALEWFRQLAAALDYAHAQQVVHRDIKPDNVLIRKSGEAVITDFGIAKVLGAATGLTRTGTTVGTGYYMSPEQWVGGELTAAADQYSLGVVLFETLSGSRPFHGESLTALMTAHLSDEPPDLSQLRSDVPLPVCRVIARMLAKEPQERFPRLADALRAAGLAPPSAGSRPGVAEGVPAPGPDLIDVDAEEPEPEEGAAPDPEPGAPDPLEPDPRAPDPADVEFVGPGAGSPSATEVVSPPPTEDRAAPRRAEPPVASGPSPSPSGGEAPPPAVDPPLRTPGEETAEIDGAWGGRRGLLVGGGALLLILAFWAITSMGSGDGAVGLVLSTDSLAIGGPGEERIVQLDGVDADGGVVAVDGVEWSSEDPAVASVAPSGTSDVRVAGVAAGGTWVRARAGRLEARLRVEVAGGGRIAQGPGNDVGPESGDEGGEEGGGEAGADPETGGDPGPGAPPETPSGVRLAVQGSLALEVGEGTTVRAAAPPGTPIQWVVDDAALVRVRGTGDQVVVEGLAPGRTTLRARAGTMEDSAPVEVRAESVAAVAVAPRQVELELGARSSLQAAVQGARSPRLDRPVEWVSRQPEVAAVGAGGVVESRGEGRTWIVARAGGAMDSVPVVVLAAPSVTGTSVGVVAADGLVRMAAAFRVQPRALTVCVEGSVRFDGGEWRSMGRQTLEAGPGAARGIFERAFADLGLPTVGNARRRVDPRARVWTGACDGSAAGEPVEVMEAPPVCLVRYLARDWEVEACD